MSQRLGTRLLFCLPALGLLAGCALPLPVQMASWALDGISFITTRKSLADHGLSLIAQQDCAIWRGIVGGTVCVTDDAGIIAVASAKVDVNGMATSRNDMPPPASVAPAIRSSFIPQRIDTYIADSDEFVGGLENFVTASGVVGPEVKKSNYAQAETPVAMVSPPPPPLPTTTVKVPKVADLFYVIGRFSRVSGAKRMAWRYARLGPEVIETKDGGGRVFRVMVGPFSRDHQDRVKGRILRSGINNARVAHMDGSERFVARYYSIVANTDKRYKPKAVSRLQIDVVVAKVASFTKYKMALLRFLGV